MSEYENDHNAIAAAITAAVTKERQEILAIVERIAQLAQRRDGKIGSEPPFADDIQRYGLEACEMIADEIKKRGNQ